MFRARRIHCLWGAKKHTEHHNSPPKRPHPGELKTSVHPTIRRTPRPTSLFFFTMAGGKKKKKPVSNPARGFATTSIASKPKPEILDTSTSDENRVILDQSSNSKNGIDAALAIASKDEKSATLPAQISPEEFEKQLEESELQVLVDKHSQKAKRDAARQISRLQTDRRVLRGQADALNTRKWLPPELTEEILDVIIADGRSATHASIQDHVGTQKSLGEEDLTIKLWTLQQTLDGAGFRVDKVQLVLDYILSISDKVVTGNKDSLWGLEESLEWLARECPREELPDYDNWQRKTQVLKSQIGKYYIPMRFIVLFVPLLA